MAKHHREVPVGDYRYNAVDDLMTVWNSNFTSRIGDGSGDAEEEYLEILRLVAACKPRANLLDIGSGLGRIVKHLSDDVGTIVGLEPDLTRFSECHATCHDGGRVRIINGTSTAYKAANPDRRFDMVVVSMVIQHIPTAVCDTILADVHDLLADDGVGVVATTQQEEERFGYQKDQTHRTREEFDRYASDSSSQAQGIPVRQFSRVSFLGSLHRAGLDVIRWGQFSYIRPEKLGWFAAWMQSTPERIRDVGTSQYAVVRRRRAA